MSVAPLARATRADHWWESKMPPILGVALAWIAAAAPEPADAWRLLATAFLTTGVAVGVFGYAINDVCDLASDRRAGKPNRSARLSPAARVALLAGSLAAAFAPLAVVEYGPLAVWLLAAELLMVTLYAAPPVRLKERGAVGVLADAAGAHVLPAAFLLAAFAHAAAPGAGLAGRPLLVAALLAWSGAFGAKGILLHQLADRGRDLRSGVRTVATARDPGRLHRLIGGPLYAAEAVAFTALVLALAPAAPLLAAAFAAHVLLDLARRRVGRRFRFGEGSEAFDRRHAPLADSAFYELGFPLALALQLGLRDPGFLPLAPLIAIAFAGNARAQLADLRRLARELQERRERARRGGWELEAEDARARVTASPERDEAEVFIERPARDRLAIRLSRGAPPLPLHPRYRLSYEARAWPPRSIVAVVSSRGRPAHDEAWSPVPLDAGWRSEALELGAGPLEECRLVFFVGASRGRVAVRRVRLSALPGAAEER